MPAHRRPPRSRPALGTPRFTKRHRLGPRVPVSRGASKGGGSTQGTSTPVPYTPSFLVRNTTPHPAEGITEGILYRTHHPFNPHINTNYVYQSYAHLLPPSLLTPFFILQEPHRRAIHEKGTTFVLAQRPRGGPPAISPPLNRRLFLTFLTRSREFLQKLTVWGMD